MAKKTKKIAEPVESADEGYTQTALLPPEPAKTGLSIQVDLKEYHAHGSNRLEVKVSLLKDGEVISSDLDWVTVK